MSSDKLKAMIIVMILIFKINAIECDSLLANEILIVYKKIQNSLVNNDIQSLKNFFASDTVEYFYHSCPDPDTIGKLRKHVWGTQDFDNNIIHALSNHWLAYIIPKNDSIIWTSNFPCNKMLSDQKLSIKRNKTEKKIFETIREEGQQFETGYGYNVVFKKISKNVYKIIKIQHNDSC